MPNRENKNSMQGVHLGNVTLSGTTPAASSWFDTTGFDAVTLLVVANTITDAGTASGFSAEMQESNATAASGATAVADAEIVGSESDLTVTSDSADNTLVGGLGYTGDAKYVRLNFTGTTGTDADVSVIAIGTLASASPPTFVGTKVAAT